MAVIAGWVSLLAMMSAALRSFWGTDYPPVWDNLSYQTLGLEAGRSILDGNWKYFLSWTGENVPPAYAFCIGLFHIFFGFSTSAPYYLSALFAFGILILIYLLAVELGAGRKESLFLVIFYSVLPNFIYQNFFQTRNDFILGFFIILFNYLVVLSLKQKDASVMFYAGISAGIGTLFKLSAPGYFIWIFIFFLIIPDVHNSFFVRLKCLLLAVAGAVLSCAWFYLPALPKIVRYYSKWTDYADGQYHLISISDRLFFYAKNFLFNHLTVPGTVFLLVFFLLSAVWTAFRKNREDIIQDYKESIKNSRIILIFAGYFSTVVFLTLRSSFSTAADNPLLPVFFSLIAAVSGGVTKRESFSPALYSCAVFVLLLFFLNSVSKIPKEIIPDKAEFISFASAVREFRQRYLIQNGRMIQSFSHPVYNTDTYRWSELLNVKSNTEKTVKSAVSSEDWSDVLTLKDMQKTYSILRKYDMLLMSDSNPKLFGGEYFTQVNLNWEELSAQIYKSDSFYCPEKFYIKSQSVHLSMCINRNFVGIEIPEVYSDGWIVWNTPVKLFSYEGKILTAGGIPVRHITEFLMENENREEKIVFRLKNVDSQGNYNFEGFIKGDQNIRSFRLKTAPENMKLGSALDPRQLAFRNLKFSVSVP